MGGSQGIYIEDDLKRTFVPRPSKRRDIRAMGSRKGDFLLISQVWMAIWASSGPWPGIFPIGHDRHRPVPTLILYGNGYGIPIFWFRRSGQVMEGLRLQAPRDLRGGRASPGPCPAVVAVVGGGGGGGLLVTIPTGWLVYGGPGRVDGQAMFYMGLVVGTKT